MLYWGDRGRRIGTSSVPRWTQLCFAKAPLRRVGRGIEQAAGGILGRLREHPRLHHPFVVGARGQVHLDQVRHRSRGGCGEHGGHGRVRTQRRARRNARPRRRAARHRLRLRRRAAARRRPRRAPRRSPGSAPPPRPASPAGRALPAPARTPRRSRRSSAPAAGGGHRPGPRWRVLRPSARTHAPPCRRARPRGQPIRAATAPAPGAGPPAGSCSRMCATRRSRRSFAAGSTAASSQACATAARLRGGAARRDAVPARPLRSRVRPRGRR